MTPLLSIIVPIYNKVSFIDFCIQSILNQTVTDFELILVDDGSTDGSEARCDFYAKTDSRIIVIHQANRGVHAARNAGLEIALGIYIGFADSDDMLDDNMYDVLIRNAIKHDADISMCGLRRIFPQKTQLFGGAGITRLYDKDQGITGLLNGGILMSTYDKIYKRDTVKNIRFESANMEDTLYNFEAFKASQKSVYDDTILYSYMIRDSSQSMASFSHKYMNMLGHTQKMLTTCQEEMPQHVEDAKSFDFNTNMIVLNLILLESKKIHPREYRAVADHLGQYATFYMTAEGVQARYKYGYALFRISAGLYTAVLRMYSFCTNSEHLNRKKKLVDQNTEIKTAEV